jgi:ParB-like chromosome segregation protein Spo0J
MSQLIEQLDQSLFVLRTEHWELARFILDPTQVARHTDPERIRLFGMNMIAQGQLHAVSATEDGRMIAGHQRALAAESAGIKTLLTNVYPATLPLNRFKIIRISENVHRTDNTAWEKHQACVELMLMNPSWNQLTLAEHLSLSAASVSYLLTPSKLPKQWQDALKDGKVTIKDCVAASKADKSALEGLLALRLSGKSAAEVEVAARKPRTQSTVKLDRVPLRLPGGCTVTVTGKDIDGESLVNALTTAREAAMKGNKEGLNVKTLSKAMADKARV